MACEQYLNAIHELVDGTLGPLRRTELELHLESCDACRALAGDLLEIARATKSLDRLEPPARVWTDIAARLRQEGRVAHASHSGARRTYTTLALAAALVLAVGASLFVLIPSRRGPSAPAPQATAAPAAPGNAATDDPVQGIAKELELSAQHLKNAIERAKAVDPATAAVLEKNAHVIDQALADSRKALEADPTSAAARQSVYDVLKQKIQFVQDTIALMNVMRQGDAAGAAQLIESGKS
jgi:Putative zinc-finger